MRLRFWYRLFAKHEKYVTLCELQVTTSEDTLNALEVSTPTLVWGSTES